MQLTTVAHFVEMGLGEVNDFPLRRSIAVDRTSTDSLRLFSRTRWNVSRETFLIHTTMSCRVQIL